MVKFYVSIIFLLLNIVGHKIWECPEARGKRDKNVTFYIFMPLLYCCKENDRPVLLNYQKLNVTNGESSNSGDNQIFQNKRLQGTSKG